MASNFQSNELIMIDIPEELVQEIANMIEERCQGCHIEGPYQGDMAGTAKIKMNFNSAAIAESVYRQIRYFQYKNYIFTIFPYTPANHKASTDLSKRLQFDKIDPTFTVADIHDVFNNAGEVLFVKINDTNSGHILRGYVQYADTASKMNMIQNRNQYLPADVRISFQEKNKLYLYPMPTDGLSNEKISSFFKGVRGFTHAERVPDQNYGFAYFDSKESMETALQMHSITIGNQAITISLAAEKNSKIFIRNLHSTTTEADILQLFSVFGTIKNTKVSATKGSPKTAIVQFQKSKSAKDAINASKAQNGFYGFVISQFKKMKKKGKQT